MTQWPFVGKSSDYLLVTTTALVGLQIFLMEESPLLSRVGSGLVLGFGAASIATIWLAGRDHAKLRRAVAVLFVACGAGSLALMTYKFSEVMIKLMSQFAIYWRA